MSFRASRRRGPSATFLELGLTRLPEEARRLSEDVCVKVTFGSSRKTQPGCARVHLGGIADADAFPAETVAAGSKRRRAVSRSAPRRRFNRRSFGSAVREALSSRSCPTEQHDGRSWHVRGEVTALLPGAVPASVRAPELGVYVS